MSNVRSIRGVVIKTPTHGTKTHVFIKIHSLKKEVVDELQFQLQCAGWGNPMHRVIKNGKTELSYYLEVDHDHR